MRLDSTLQLIEGQIGDKFIQLKIAHNQVIHFVQSKSIMLTENIWGALASAIGVSFVSQFG